MLGREPDVVVRRATEQFVTAVQGRTTRHAFSFGEHYDPDRISYGPLMVCNTDLLQADSGYPNHPHHDAEIITWVLSGSLRHSDSFGNVGVVHPGLAQRMSAGSGLVHAEVNDAHRFGRRPAEPVHFVQMWLRPDQSGATPGYAQRELVLADLDDALVPVASADHPDAAIDLGTAQATLWATRLTSGVRRALPDGDSLFLLICRGEVDLEGVGTLRASVSSGGDLVQLDGRGGSLITGRADAEVLVWQFGR